jgi:hypothetical protein
VLFQFSSHFLDQLIKKLALSISISSKHQFSEARVLPFQYLMIWVCSVRDSAQLWEILQPSINCFFLACQRKPELFQFPSIWAPSERSCAQNPGLSFFCFFRFFGAFSETSAFSKSDDLGLFRMLLQAKPRPQLFPKNLLFGGEN